MIDLLVNLLQCPLREGDEESHMIRIFKEAYDVLHAYMIGKSRKNALYFAKYIDFFQTQFTQKVNIYFCNLCMYNHDNKCYPFDLLYQHAQQTGQESNLQEIFY